MVDDESRNGLMCYGSKRLGWVTKVEHDAEVAQLTEQRDRAVRLLRLSQEWAPYLKAHGAGMYRGMLDDFLSEIDRGQA